MDITKCFAILEARSKESPNFTATTLDNGQITISINDESLTTSIKLVNESPLTLISLLLSLQEERVYTYKIFEDELKILVSTNSFESYPQLCSEITQKFASISRSVLAVKNAFANQGNVEVPKLINVIQEKEKEKLTYVAARHLDVLQDSLSGLRTMTGGKSQQQQDYLRNKIAEVQDAIAEVVENIQALKCDYVE